MQNKNNQIQQIICRWLFFLLIWFAAFVLTSLTPLIADDYNYAFSWSYASRVDNLYLLIGSMAGHRRWTHGRVFAQGWVTLFMMWPKWAFSLANALIITLFFFALFRFYKKQNIQIAFSATVMVAALLWVCMPVFGQVFLWLDGSCNYFWGASLGWIMIVQALSLQERNRPWLATMMLLPLAFAFGAWSEHISFAGLVILFLFLIRNWKRTKRFPVFMFTQLLTGGLGYLFLMLAPSMLPSILKSRARTAATEHMRTLSNVMTEYWWIIRAAAILVLLTVCWLQTKKGWRRKLSALAGILCLVTLLADVYFAFSAFREGGIGNLISSTPVGFLTLQVIFLAGLQTAAHQTDDILIADALILWAGGLCALVPFALAMYIPARGFCAPVVFSSISASMLWHSEPNRKSFRRILYIALAALTILCFVVGCSDILAVHHASEEREEAIYRALETDGVLVTEPYPVRSKYSAQYGLQDLAPGESWPNDVEKEYYGLQDIRVIERSAS